MFKGRIRKGEMMRIKNNLTYFVTRKEPEKHQKYKYIDSKSQVTNRAKLLDYEYYKCDYCDKEIIIKEDWSEKSGSIVKIPAIITKNKEIVLALHNKCLKLVLKEFEGRTTNEQK